MTTSKESTSKNLMLWYSTDEKRNAHRFLFANMKERDSKT
jgi:hypothetical protein